MRRLALVFSAVLFVAMRPASAETGVVPADLGLVYAMSETTEGVPRTSIYLHGVGPGPARIYIAMRMRRTRSSPRSRGAISWAAVTQCPPEMSM